MMTSETNYASEFYSFLTGKVSTAIGRRLQRNFKESGIQITAEQWSVLYYLWDAEGLSQQEIAKLMHLSRKQINRILFKLKNIIKN